MHHGIIIIYIALSSTQATPTNRIAVDGHSKENPSIQDIRHLEELRCCLLRESSPAEIRAA